MRTGKNKSPAEDLDVPPESLSSQYGPKHVVLVMNALGRFSTKPLEWALEHVAEPGCVVTLLGVTPWLSFALSCKKRLDIWTWDCEDLSKMKECPEWKNDAPYQKLRTVVDLCESRGVVPLKKVAMGHPEQHIALEMTTKLHATWVVFDRHHRKWSTFYQERIPCNMVFMNGDGQVDMFKARSTLDSEETITPPVSKIIMPKARTEIFNKVRKKEVNEVEKSS
ncbi:hypothetical protein COCNU_04G006600 [Cocos nucifera]|uniref:Uncharacterized protein n=1 Tax=Cocos nucifera TaxID=13894 RepID=A0A8K0I6G8_COCNU|nr:hypothetical protein COCNU_04G006600 [Cocos nucifera]